MQRWRHPGNKKEWGDWIVLTIEADMSEAGLQSACEQLNAATSDMEQFLDLGDGNQSQDYKIVFLVDGKPVHERDFFHEAVKIAKLRPLVSEYIANVNHESNSWQDEFHPRGSFALAELTLVDEKYLPQLASLLFKWDMGHETYQYTLIDQLFEKYGYTEQTLQLLAARVCADGQHIDENVWRAIHCHGFKEKIDIEHFVDIALELLPYPEAAWQLESFARIYAGQDEATYLLTVEVITKALRHDRKFEAVLDEVLNQFSGKFEEHNLMQTGNDFWSKPVMDWNADLENAVIENSDFTKLAKIDIGLA
ncbi:hypothetical protein ACO0LC_20465 [Undibacterium sp. JH2W]|uniref:hypothetical protein n=1 Tax=Undibacterium sp. JH2W TaxID=3413037 RepID=UPI003BF34D50